MKPLTAGRVARRLLAFYQNDPKRWTQKTYARDANGDTVNFWSPGATCFCSLGALGVILDTTKSEERRDRFHEATDVLRAAAGKPVALLNDSCISFYEFKTELKRIARLP